MGERHEGHAEVCAVFTCGGGEVLDCCTVGRSGGCAEAPVDRFFGDRVLPDGELVRLAFSASRVDGSGSPCVRGGYIRSTVFLAAVATRPPIRPATRPLARDFVRTFFVIFT